MDKAPPVSRAIGAQVARLRTCLTRWLSRVRRVSTETWPRFTTLEQHAVSGRGSLHLIANPTTSPHLPVSTGQHIILNNQPVRVLHVEGFCKNGFFHQGDRIAILVTPLTL